MIKIDETKSIFAKEDIYNQKDIQAYLNVLDNHLCKISRLGNGKVRIEHLTHNPINQSNFTYLGNKDLYGQLRAQYQSTTSFEIDENMITFMAPINTANPDLYNKIIQENQSLNIISEKSFFFNYNNGIRDFKYYSDVKDQIMSHHEVFTDIISDIFEK